MYRFLTLCVSLLALWAFSPVDVAGDYCTSAPPSSSREDRRSDTSKLSIATYNSKWLFQSSNLGWNDDFDAMDSHFDEVADMVKRMNADIVQLTEVEDCAALDELIKRIAALGDNTYKAYLVPGTDSSTRQNVGLISRIDPSVDMQRTEERSSYPIEGSTCSKDTSISGTSGSSKHFYTQFDVDGFNNAFLFVGVHFLSQPTKVSNCLKREAQAKVIEGIIQSEGASKYVVVAGDFNDLDENVIGADGQKPISQVLNNIRETGKLMNAAAELPQNERITYYSSKYQSLIDHILMSNDLSGAIIDVESYADYTPYVNNTQYDSDHFPIVVRLDAAKA